MLLPGTVSSPALHDLLFQKRVAADIVQDLRFDLQTGKLSSADHDELAGEQQRQIAALDERLDRLQRSGKDEITARLENEIAQARAKLGPPRSDAAACPGCGKSAPRDAKFCSHCGAALKKIQ